MRPTISWADLRGAAVGVWGLGVEGAANVRRLLALGVEPVLVDDRATEHEGRPVVPTAGGGIEALTACEVVVKTPGISRYRDDVAALEARGVPVVGGLGLWLQGVDRSRVVCITGTKGKSTTTAVLGHLLTRLGHRTLVGGNIGQPPWDPAVGDAYDWWVVETSSYQATDVGASPPVVAVTSLHADHLDWHAGDPETYYRDKLSLCRQPGARVTVANGASPLLRQRAALLGPTVRWVSPDVADASWTEPLGLIGRHNVTNALVARACLDELGVTEAADDDALRRAAAGFAGLDSRLRLVARVGGVDFVDDSLSTNVLPTLAAVDAFPRRRIALIAGGFDRGIDYGPLAEGLASRPADTLVLTLPACGPRIEAALAAARPPRVEALACPDLPTAVRRGAAWARPDGVVLLSPAAPSFGQFRDYRERARVFAEAVDALAEGDPGTDDGSARAGTGTGTGVSPPRPAPAPPG